MSDYFGTGVSEAAPAAAEQPQAEAPQLHQQPEQQQQQQNMVAETAQEDPETRLARGRAREIETVALIYAAARARELGQFSGAMATAYCLEY